MPDNNASGFIDFNQYSEQNAGAEKDLLERAMQRAEESTTKEKAALRKSEIEARDSGKGLSQAVSYSDYLKSSRESASAWAAVTARSRDPRAAALQGSIGQDASARAAAATAGSAQRREEIGSRVDETHEGAARMRAARADYEAKQAEAKKAEEERQAGAMQAYQASLRGKFAGDWGRMDASQNSFGFDPKKTFTIYGENLSPFGEQNSDSQRLAQQARNVGMNDEADRYQSGATYEWGKRTKGGY